MKIARTLATFSLVLVFTLSLARATHAGTTQVYGWLWSSSVGWFSMNSNNPEIISGGGAAYSVSVATTTGSSIGTLSGYAWSPNVGWLSFNAADVTGCPTNDTWSVTNALNGCTPSMNMTTGKVTGWARALAALPAGGPSGWDGWVQLSGTNHTSPDTSGPSGTSALGVTLSPATGGISGYAWSGALQSTAGLTISTTTVSSLNLQTDLYYQFISVTNNTNQTLAGLRAVEYTTLPASATLYNFSGKDAQNFKYLQYNYPVVPGQTVVMNATFYDTARNLNVSTPKISYVVSAITAPIAEPSLPTGSILASVSATNLTGGGSTGMPQTYAFYIQPTTPGTYYMIQYSDDSGATWHTMFGQSSTAAMMKATANAISFADFGAPNAISSPTSVRQYRAYALPSAQADRSVVDAGSYLPTITPVDVGTIGWLSFYAVAVGTTTPPVNPAGMPYFMLSGSTVSLDNSAGQVTGSGLVTVTGYGSTTPQTIAMSSNRSMLASGLTISAPSPATCTVSTILPSCNVMYNVTAQASVPDGTVTSFEAQGARAVSGSIPALVASSSVSINVHNTILPPPAAVSGINLWAGTSTATSTHTYITVANKVVPIYWTVKDYGYCTASVPSSPSGASGFSGWTSMATTTTDRTTGATYIINSSLTKLSSGNQVKLTPNGNYTFKLNCFPVNSSGVKTGGAAIDSNLLNIRVTSSSVIEF